MPVPSRKPLRTYTRARWIVYGAMVVGLFLLPTLGAIKFDALSGRHLLWFSPAPLLSVLRVFVLACLAYAVLMLLATYFIGRFQCGWGCPGMVFARLSKGINERYQAAPGSSWRRHASLLGAATVLAPVFLNWFMDLPVLARPDSPHFTAAWAMLLACVAGTHVALRYIEFAWCRHACPAGWYLGLMSQICYLSIGLPEPEHCLACDACQRKCPIDLDPVSPAFEMSACLVCGDCLEACDAVFVRRGGQDAPLHWVFARHSRHADEARYQQAQRERADRQRRVAEREARKRALRAAREKAPAGTPQPSSRHGAPAA